MHGYFGFKKKLNHQSQGFSIVEALVAISLLGILAIGVTQLISTGQSQQKRMLLSKKFAMLQNNFSDVISGQGSWHNTLSDAVLNPNLSCLRTRTDCSSFYAANYGSVASTARIVLKDANNQIFYDGRSTNTAGFTEDGAVCNTFTYAAAGNDNCPIGYIVNWRTVNSTATTSDLHIAVTAKLIYNPTNSNKLKSFFNRNTTDTVLKKYDIEIFRAAYDAQIDQYLYKCVPGSTKACVTDANSLLMTKTCNTSGNGYGECRVVTCKAGFNPDLANNTCVCVGYPAIQFRNGYCQ
jgi:type II secretory pathway pseudopilin PulG